MCIATSPSDISAIYKDSEYLSYDPFVKDVLLRMGVSSASIEKWIPDSGVNSAWNRRDGSKPSIHDVSHVGPKLCRQQLLPGKEFDVLSTKLINDIEQSLQWHKISESITVFSTDKTKRVSLHGWCREVLVASATRSFFSNRLLQIDPNLFENFYKFDENSWKALFKYPGFLSRDMDDAKNRIIDALSRYFFLPKDERKGESWLISNIEAEMIKAGIDDLTEMASIVMPLYWAYVTSLSRRCIRLSAQKTSYNICAKFTYHRINANAYKSAFWTLAYVLHDESLVGALREEIAPIFAQGTTNLGSRIEGCRLLESVYLESLRLSSSSATIRAVQHTTTVGGFTLQKGIKILVPFCQLHLDDSVWGPTPTQFDPERFLKNGHLRQSPSFKPFGGGTTYCPGRFLARLEVMALVAVVLHRFDVTLSPSQGASMKQRLPRIDHRTLSVSLMSPMAGDDLLLDVKLARLNDGVA